MALLKSFRTFSQKPFLCHSRLFSSNPVKLEYDVVNHSSSSLPTEIPDVPCVMLHGLLGSRRNLRSLARHFPFSSFLFPDLRNHGRSPHSESMAIDAMASDVVHLLDRLEIEEAAIVGHSLGGKVAMATAVLAPSRVKALAVLDIAPVYKDIEQLCKERGIPNPRSDIFNLLDLLISVPINELDTRAEVEKFLIKNHNGPKPLSQPLVQFLLQNLEVRKDGIIKWAPNLQILRQQFNQVDNWPFTTQYSRGPVAVVKGARSPWIQPEQLPAFRKIFPHAVFRSVDGTHWLHMEAPQDVAAQVLDAWVEGFNGAA